MSVISSSKFSQDLVVEHTLMIHWRLCKDGVRRLQNRVLGNSKVYFRGFGELKCTRMGPKWTLNFFSALQSLRKRLKSTFSIEKSLKFAPKTRFCKRLPQKPASREEKREFWSQISIEFEFWARTGRYCGLRQNWRETPPWLFVIEIFLNGWKC